MHPAMHPEITPGVRDRDVVNGRPAFACRAGRPAAAGPGPRARRPVATAPDLPCRTDPELFFAEAPEDVQRAKVLCSRCPVQPACLAGALQRGEPCGVWGGALFQRGVVIPEKRRRGRPRKADVAA